MQLEKVNEMKRLNNTLKEYFLPNTEKDVQMLIDGNSVKNIQYISLVVVVFEMFTLAIYIVSRKNYGIEELTSILSVLFCILTCLAGYFLAKYILKKESPDHQKVLMFKAIYFSSMSIWAIWNAYRQYGRGEQILTFYAVILMLVCFITLRPWLSTLLMTCVYIFLYVTLYSIDGAKQLNMLNYFVLALVSIIGMAVRYHAMIRMSEATVLLQKAKDSEVQDKMNILQAIADIYDNVNLLDFNGNTEMSVRDKEHIKHELDLVSEKHTLMSRKIRKRIMPDQRESFIEYTDISTIRTRLVGKRLLSYDFIDIVDGWFRAQYIPVETDENGIPIRIVFTTRNVDEEKQREERLVSIAMTDELTRLFNRRCYEEDLSEYRTKGLDDGFVVMCADVNGLKKVNDTVGHAAGDELIKGAAECLFLAVSNTGRVYRTGGDEFVAILHTDDPESVCRAIEKRTEEWKGIYSKKLSISIGYAVWADDKSLSLNELEKKADDAMYASKAGYYEKKGIDRRHR